MNDQTPHPSNLTAILRLLRNAKVTAFVQDANLRYRWIETPPADWNSGEVDGKSDLDILPAKAAALLTSAKRDVLNSGRPQWMDFSVDFAGGTRHFDLYIEPEYDPSGALVGVAGLAVDVTDRRAHATTMESVAREQAHRTKNLLAVIQSLGTQTARSSASIDDFIDSFRGRIQSISRSQDLSIGDKRHGAKLSELIETQIHPYISDIKRQFAFAGEDRYLNAAGALHVGLAFYELCIAATQSGSLSQPDGKVEVAAAIVDDSTGNQPRFLEVTWREINGPAARPMDDFSKVLLERIVPAAVGGRATLSENDAGRSYALTIAATDFE